MSNYIAINMRLTSHFRVLSLRHQHMEKPLSLLPPW